MVKNKKSNFFTNQEGNTLIDQFNKSIKYAKYFDILVGYFRISGFHLLYKELENVDKIRILIGINTDQQTFDLTQKSKQQELELVSSIETIERTKKSIVDEISKSDDSYDTKISIEKFIEFLQTDCPDPDHDKKNNGNGKKMEIKVYPSQDLHAKVYISRHKDDFVNISEGSVITGSSNFSKAGLKQNKELNVILRDPNDLEFALDYFESLWKDSVDTSQIFVETLSKDTWINDDITPYELYIKMLYEYFEKDINLDKEIQFTTPEGFLDLEYQKEAVMSALKILDGYGGLFIADVVGLGKTYISALLAQQLVSNNHILIICPPVLKEYWEETFLEFKVPCKVESKGKLDKIDSDKYDVIFIDEAHSFRNDNTVSFEKIHNIVYGKKVVLVSATPQNNTFKDLYNLITLFQSPRNSLIPGIKDLEGYFSNIEKKISNIKKNGTDDEYEKALKSASSHIRSNVLRHLMVRRTRKEIKKYYTSDMKAQGLFFPKLNKPHSISYGLDSTLSSIFENTLFGIKELSYARYQPIKYLKKDKLQDYSIGDFELNQQLNLSGFMKTTLVKRLESSFYAFKKTVNRMISSYEDFIDMYESGEVLVSKKYNVYDLIHLDNLNDVLKGFHAGEVKRYKSEDFQDNFLKLLIDDLNTLKSIENEWKDIKSDPKLDALKETINKSLINQKIIIFTESKETARYLFDHMNEVYNGKVMVYASDFQKISNIDISKNIAKNIIRKNFDPTSKEQSEDIQILISTDILSEGMNMHRSSKVLNYDLPWNPTKVLQRAGRINRIGSEHNNLDIYNFFPMDISEQEINLTQNITRKIQAFHDTLGEDAKYLTDKEELSTHNLSGQNLVNKLSDTKTYLDGEDEDELSELKYLKIVQDIRDNDLTLFNKIKNVPKKSRLAIKDTKDHLITFFRSGELKKFIMTDKENSTKEIDFFQAVKLFESTPKEKSIITSDDENLDYFSLLSKNKDFIYELSNQESSGDLSKRKGRSNEKEVLKRLKKLKKEKAFTNYEKSFIKSVISKYQVGDITATSTRRVKNALEQQADPHKALYIIKNEFDKEFLLKKRMTKNESSSLKTSEVILSKYSINK